MTRDEALTRLRLLAGQDLRPLAAAHGVTFAKGGKINKGWAGQVLEKYLGLPNNSRQAPDFGDWELKIVPLQRAGAGWRVKETMAITMIDPKDVIARPFEHSHLLEKLQSLVLAAREFVDKKESRAPFVTAAGFDLYDSGLYCQVEADYQVIREIIRARGLAAVTGAAGKLVQARTKGTGRGSVSKAFYARTQFVARILKLAGGTE